MILIGTLVHWHDPAINDYTKEDREILLDTIFKVVDINDDEGTALIVCEEDTSYSVEVYLSELEEL